MFASTPRHRKDVDRIHESRATVAPKRETLENVKPELAQKGNVVERNNTGKRDGLLSEKVTSNAEQRKADWAIMKEMTKYLWPKVHIRQDTVKFQRLIGYARTTSVPDSASDSL